MFSILKNLSISIRLALALVPIMIGLGYLSNIRYAEQTQLLEESKTFITLNNLVNGLGNLIYGIQKERGMSALFLGSKGGSYRVELHDQRSKVDQYLVEFSEIIANTPVKSNTTFISRANDLKIEINERLSKRSTIDAVAISVPEEIAGYTKTIAALIGYIADLSKVSDRSDISNSIIANVALIECVERAGQERATGSAGFSSGSFAGGLNNRVIYLIAEQAAYLGMFRRVANINQTSALEAVLASASDSNVQLMRRAIINTAERNGTDNNITNISAGDWFKTTTERIDALRTVSDKVQADLHTLVDTIYHDAQATLTSVLVWIAVGCGFAGTMISIVIFGITRPIIRITKSMTKLASGDVNIDIPEVSFNDEVGQMAEAMRVFRDSVIERDRLLLEERALQEKEENLSKQLQEDAMEHLKGIVNVATKSNEAFFGLAEMGVEIKKIAADSQAIAAAVDELVSSAGHIAENSVTVEERSRSAAEAASDGLSATQQTLSAMAKITTSVEQTAKAVTSLDQISSQIGKMLGAIEGIAKQTNLLALNATIEAARAGEAGKGFAVVASEVKQLANQTARVTEDIRQRIGILETETKAIITSMNDSGSAVREGRETIADLAKHVGGFRDITADVTNRMSEVANILQQHNGASAEIARTVSSIAGKTAHNAQALNSILDVMDGSLKVVNERVDKFSVITTGAAIVEIAKKDHSQFRNSIISVALGRMKMNVQDVSSHQSCRFGKWYSGVGKEIASKSHAYGAIDAPHQLVHDHAKRAVELANAGEIDNSMREVSLMNDASRQVLACLDEISAYYAREEGSSRVAR